MNGDFGVVAGGLVPSTYLDWGRLWALRRTIENLRVGREGVKVYSTGT